MSELTGLPWFIKIRKRHHPRPSMSANQFKDFFKSRPAASTLKSLQIVCRHRRSRMLGRFTIISNYLHTIKKQKSYSGHFAKQLKLCGLLRKPELYFTLRSLRAK